MWRNFASRKKMAGGRFIDLRARARQFQIIIKKNGLETKNQKDPVRPADGSGVSPSSSFPPLIDWAIVFAGNDSGRPPNPDGSITNGRFVFHGTPQHPPLVPPPTKEKKKKRYPPLPRTQSINNKKRKKCHDGDNIEEFSIRIGFCVH